MMKFLPKCLTAGLLMAALTGGGSALAQTVTASPDVIPPAGGTVSIDYSDATATIFGFTYFLQYNAAELTVGTCTTNANSLGIGSIVSCDTSQSGVVQINALNFAAALEATTAATPAATIDFTSVAVGDSALTADTTTSACSDQIGGAVACTFVVAPVRPVAPPVGTCTLTDVTFPNTDVGTTSTEVTSTLTNTGATPLDPITVALATGTNFALGTNNCAAPLAAGASCTIGVTFSPAAAGPAADTLNVTGAATCSAAVTGTGIDVVGPLPPVLSADPTTLTLTTTPGNTATQTATLSNTGGSLLTYGALAVSGVDAANFAITGGTCAIAGGTLAPAAACTIIATFTAPAVEGTSGAQIAVTSDGGNATIGLVGVSSLVTIPTLSEWAMIIMASLMLMLGAVTLRRNGYFK